MVKKDTKNSADKIISDLYAKKSDRILSKNYDWILGIPIFILAFLLLFYLYNLIINPSELRLILYYTLISSAFTLILALFFTWTNKLGKFGHIISEKFSRVPLLDLALALFSWIPWIIGFVFGGGAGLIGIILGQAIALQMWAWIHESLHKEDVRGPRIHKFLNKRFGWWRNHIALWATLIVLPLFLIIRLAEIFVYPWMVWLLGWPKYNQSEWISVSRYKFRGLVGQDLIWCLYCDWMTGVISLSSQMLRVTESFWCPIRFYDAVKNKYCLQDFPDIDRWVSNKGKMKDVEELLDNMYPDIENKKEVKKHG